MKVYTSPSHTSSGDERVYHEDPECPFLASARNILEKDRNVLWDDTRPCSHCGSDDGD